MNWKRNMCRDCDNEKFASFGVAVDGAEVYDVEAVLIA